MNKKLMLAFAIVAVTMLAICFVLYPFTMNYVKIESGANLNLDMVSRSIHCTITMVKNGVKVFEQYHAGAVTNLGRNVTLAKLTGNYTAYTFSSYNTTQYRLNLTEISIGTGTPAAASTCLPGEWNRTVATQHDWTYNTFNMTAVFHPGTGPYTADCIGINFESGLLNNALWGYDTFTQVTGIDSTFTITIEFKVTVS